MVHTEVFRNNMFHWADSCSQSLLELNLFGYSRVRGIVQHTEACGRVFRLVTSEFPQVHIFQVVTVRTGYKALWQSP